MKTEVEVSDVSFTTGTTSSSPPSSSPPSLSSTSSLPPPFRKTPPQILLLYRYSIDVVSDGTEYTNTSFHVNGNNSNNSGKNLNTIPTLFLSIWKTTTIATRSDANGGDEKNHNDDADDVDGGWCLLARYGLSGVSSCDGLARIAADQQYKLGPIRAIFSMIHHHCNSPSPSSSSSSILSDVSSLPSVLYACQQESVSLILPNPNVMDRVESLIQLVHGNHMYPKVKLCSVPTESMNQWWNVWEDDQMLVHATRRQSSRTLPTDDDDDDNNNENSISGYANGTYIAYLLTFRRLVQQHYSTGTSTTTKTRNMICPDSILILPAQDDDFLHHSLSVTSWDLPIIDIPSTTTTGDNTVMDHQTRLLHTYVLANDNNQSDISRYIDTKEETHANTIGSGTTPYSILISPNECVVTDSAETQVNDPYLLVRGRQQTLNWRQHCDTSLLEHFPYRSDQLIASPNNHCDTANGDRLPNAVKSLLPRCQCNTVLLRTGTSLMFEVRAEDVSSSKITTTTSMRIIDRNMQRKHRPPKNGRTVLDANDSTNNTRDSWPLLMKDFLLHPNMSSDTTSSRWQNDLSNYDENEIDLDIDGTSNDDCNPIISENTISMDNKPQLLILGTGCASPSPYRNASGYALILPTTTINTNTTVQGMIPDPDPTSPSTTSAVMIIAVEVGELFCTQFHRYGDGRSLTDIRLIWISHAHWDHYGGLVNLLLQIHRMIGRNTSALTVERQQKRIKLNSDRAPYSELVSCNAASTPYVIAPPKVLQYLRLIFDNPKLYYKEVHMDDAVAIDQALHDLNKINPCLSRWVNVRVDHSCLSYGFVLVLQLPKHQKPFIFVFSGDTRPCRYLVDKCRALAKQYKVCNRVDFLLHEATFDDKELNMTVTKKHSTVAEAIMVGRDMDAERLLLTHFSQRYDTVPNVHSESIRIDGRMKIGFALDGMRVFL